MKTLTTLDIIDENARLRALLGSIKKYAEKSGYQEIVAAITNKIKIMDLQRQATMEGIQPEDRPDKLGVSIW